MYSVIYKYINVLQIINKLLCKIGVYFSLIIIFMSYLYNLILDN